MYKQNYNLISRLMRYSVLIIMIAIMLGVFVVADPSDTSHSKGAHDSQVSVSSAISREAELKVH